MQSTIIENLSQFASQAKNSITPAAEWLGRQFTLLSGKASDAYQAFKPIAAQIASKTAEITLTVFSSMKNNVIKYAGEGKSLFVTNVLPLVKQYPLVTALG